MNKGYIVVVQSENKPLKCTYHTNYDDAIKDIRERREHLRQNCWITKTKLYKEEDETGISYIKHEFITNYNKTFTLYFCRNNK